MSKARKQPPTGGAAAVEEALQRFKPLLSESDFALLLDELAHPLQQALRVNTLKNPDPAEAITRWAGWYGWEVQSVPYCTTGWQVSRAGTAISQTIEHRMGYYYIQDAASMLPVSLFEMQPADRPLILDMAASPGGKTTHLVDRSGDLGFVLANDPGRDRITMLRLVLQNWGAMNTAVVRFPGEKFGQWYPETFDRVLLDAPCSMQNLRSTEARPMQSISRRELQTLSGRQKNLLWSALCAVKVGGQVVYSTCSLDPEEDEMVLDAVLQRSGAAMKVQTAGDLIPPQAAGLTSPVIEGELRTLDPQVRNAVRPWPHVLKTTGFFAAVLTKLAPLPGETEEPPRVTGSTDLTPLNTREARSFHDQIMGRFGFDFQPVLEQHESRLWQRQNVVYAIPEAWWRHFNRLPFQSVGMRIAEFDNGLVPSHEWAARFGDQFQKGIFVLPEDQITNWLRGQDIPVSVPAGQNGEVVVVRDSIGRSYGRGRITSARLRNLLPNRLVTA